MGISLYFFFLLIPFISSIYAEDKNDLIDIEQTSQIQEKTEPRKIITRTFLVTNNSTKEEPFYEEVYLPKGWQIIGPSHVSFKLKPNEKQIRLATFFIPVSASSGHYEITYLVGSQREYEINKKVLFSIDVLPLTKLEIMIEDYPKTIIAGQIFEIKIRLINRGNSRTQIELDQKVYPDYPIQIDSNIVILEAGTSRIIRYSVSTDKNLNRKTRFLLNIYALTKKIGTEEKIISDKKTVSVDIMPKITGEFDPYHRLPSKIKFIGINEDNKNGFQIQFSGKGSIDEEGEQGIEFLIRQPKIINEIPTGEIDEAYIAYNNKILDFHLGDKSFNLSPLVENNRYGKGIELDLHPAKYEIGAFNFESKFDRLGEKEAGAFFKYPIKNDLEIKTNFLNKKKDIDEDNIYSVQAYFKPDELMDINLELASNSSYREKPLNDKAYKIDLGGKFSDDFVYTFIKTYAGPDFYGYYNDYAAISGRIYYPIYKKLSGNTSYDEHKSNLDFNPIKKSSASDEKNFVTNLTYTLPSNFDISIDYKKLSNKDELLPVDFNYEENSVKLGLKQNYKNFGVNSYIERGRLNDYLINTTNNNLEKYSLFTYFSPDASQIYSIFGRIGHNSFIGSPLRTKSLGISGGWLFSRDAYLRLEYQKNNFDSEVMKEQDSIFSTFNYTLPNNNSFFLRSSWSRYEGNEKDFLVFVGYSINWGIPIRKKKSIGTLKGIVYDAERPDKLPISNVLLSINEVSAVTNQNGEFIFPSLSPGTYYLWIEKIFIGLNRVTTEKLPIAVIIKSGETTEIEIGVTTSARFFGRIAVFVPNINEISTASDQSSFLIESDKAVTGANFDSSNLKEVRNLSNILVELSDGTEFLQQVTDEKGMFSYKDIRPGKWILKINEQNLPEHFYLEQKEFQLIFTPGEVKDITIRVLPRLRKILIIEEGEIKQEK